MHILSSRPHALKPCVHLGETARLPDEALFLPLDACFQCGESDSRFAAPVGAFLPRSFSVQKSARGCADARVKDVCITYL